MPTEHTAATQAAAQAAPHTSHGSETPPRPWLTVSEVAADLHITPKIVRRLIKGGRLMAKDISTGVRPNWRIHIIWMEAFRQQSTLEGAPNAGGTTGPQTPSPE